MATRKTMAGAVEKAYRTVRARIMRGQYGEAAHITELEICKASGVSRTPVREALRRLQAEGFVTIAPNHGAVVSHWNSAEMDDLFELRALLESYGVERAAQRITPEGIAELRKLAEAQYRESTQRSDGYTQRIGEYNRRFHHVLHQFAESRRLITVLAPLVEVPTMLRTFSQYEPDELVRSAEDHLQLVKALESGKGSNAAKLMRQHILAARTSLHHDVRASKKPSVARKAKRKKA